MSYLTENQLKNYANFREAQVNKARHLKSNVKEASISIFLSHSHKDRELVLGLIGLLASYGISLYVDWQDDSMPTITSKVTAQKIKNRIYDLDYFLVLATRNAMQSRWVPWEIGIADAGKSPEKIAIIPVVDTNGVFNGNEYLQIYQRITIAQSGNLALFPPNEDEGYLLGYWFSPLSFLASVG